MMLPLLTIIVVLFIGICCPLNIIQVVPGISNSHELFNYRLAQLLINSGHNVTLFNMVIIPGHKSIDPPNNLKVFRMESKYQKSWTHYRAILETFQDSVFKDVDIWTYFKLKQALADFSVQICRDTLDQEEFVETMQRHHFDLMLSHSFSFCPNGLAKKFNIPQFIWVAPGTYIYNHAAQALSLPDLVSYVPYYSGDSSDRMNFKSRVKNFLWFLFESVRLGTNHASLIPETSAFKRYPDVDFPDVYRLAQDTKGLMINGEDFLDFPRPMIPGVIHLGDPEHKAAKSLPMEWQTLSDGSQAGVILFSLGTIANSSMMPMEMKDGFLSAFSHFKNYTIIWRLEGEMPRGLDEQTHVKIVTWIPQKDLLHHPKLKLFITHGGYNSLLETVLAGKPMILMPLFSDQYGNAHRAVRRGLGLMLDKTNINSAIIAKTMRAILDDERFHQNAIKFSSILRDKIISDEVNTVKFVEKVSRANKFWPSMKVAQRMNTFQYYSLDILSVFLSLSILVVLFLFRILVLVLCLMKKCIC